MHAPPSTLAHARWCANTLVHARLVRPGGSESWRACEPSPATTASSPGRGCCPSQCRCRCATATTAGMSWQRRCWNGPRQSPPRWRCHPTVGTILPGLPADPFPTLCPRQRPLPRRLPVVAIIALNGLVASVLYCSIFAPLCRNSVTDYPFEDMRQVASTLPIHAHAPACILASASTRPPDSCLEHRLIASLKLSNPLSALRSPRPTFVHAMM